jgi:multiple sugar transport system permease protein
MLRNLELTDTMWAVILPALASPFYVFLLRQNMISIPNELFEAAQIDRAGPVRCFFHIAIPASRAILGAAAALSFADCWNMVEQPLIYIPGKESLHPLSVVFNQLSGESTGIEFAGAALFLLPALLVYLFFQTDILTGIRISDLK